LLPHWVFQPLVHPSTFHIDMPPSICVHFIECFRGSQGEKRQLEARDPSKIKANSNKIPFTSISKGDELIRIKLIYVQWKISCGLYSLFYSMPFCNWSK
jgi:hypothetical protein